MSKQPLCAFTVRVPEEMKFQLDRIAVEENRSTNNLITVIFKEFIENREVKK